MVFHTLVGMTVRAVGLDAIDSGGEQMEHDGLFSRAQGLAILEGHRLGDVVNHLGIRMTLRIRYSHLEMDGTARIAMNHHIYKVADVGEMSR